MSDVFIIGAGCNVPYGFLTGTMLMQNLKNFDYDRKFPRKNYSDGDIFLVDYVSFPIIAFGIVSIFVCIWIAIGKQRNKYNNPANNGY